MRSLSSAALSFGLVLALPSAFAHTVWLEPVDTAPGAYQVMFGGHDDQRESYDPEKLRSVTAYDESGELLTVTREEAPDGAVRLGLPEGTVLVAIHFDNGIWTPDPMGRSVNLPLSEVEGATTATWAPKYHKTILQWTELAAEPVGQPFEVTPLSAVQPAAGKPMRVRVTLDGAPVEGIRLGHGEEGDEGITDADGIASIVPKRGFNRIWAGLRMPVEASEYTTLSYEYLLGFEAEQP